MKSRQCDGKKPYRTLKEANNAKFASMRHGADGLDAYKCPFCSQYHLGHKPKKYRRKR